MHNRHPSQFGMLIGFAAVLLFVAPPSFAQDSASGGKTAQVQEGEYLARAGDCIACHTAPTGPLFAGGLAMSTPFETLYRTNITPDPRT
jgi:mono/diheme cytochrome c family protein